MRKVTREREGEIEREEKREEEGERQNYTREKFFTKKTLQETLNYANSVKYNSVAN